ncbi:hypothetical protein LSUE1_G007071 [Lachnellula suecica]|uniref:Uncharacterized protein n=1 Tax=Lachnellula suecica TaxID=602035 RepID=A0A8T9CBM0_9HELO|nr:hypothetical protein LSUE1_G007071 [Lachnellula suecica]
MPEYMARKSQKDRNQTQRPFRRPRVIQAFYEPEAGEWQACKDGRGGLPLTLRVSREARAEALKGYTKIFDTYFDLQEDIIFISDPIFCLRKQRNMFLELEWAKLFRNVAVTGDIYHGLADAHRVYPTICSSLAGVLRRFDRLEHFSLALLEDGLDIGHTFNEADELLAFVDEDDDFDDSEEENIEEVQYDDDDVEGAQAITDDDGAAEEIRAEDQEANDRATQQYLDTLDDETLEAMSKRGYFRHTGDIHFDSAYYSDDLWDSWALYRKSLVHEFRREKNKHNDWVRPRFGIVEVKYGLNLVGEFFQILHHNGDYEDQCLEYEAFVEAVGYDSDEKSVEESSDSGA